MPDNDLKDSSTFIKDRSPSPAKHTNNSSTSLNASTSSSRPFSPHSSIWEHASPALSPHSPLHLHFLQQQQPNTTAQKQNAKAASGSLINDDPEFDAILKLTTSLHSILSLDEAEDSGQESFSVHVVQDASKSPAKFDSKSSTSSAVKNADAVDKSSARPLDYFKVATNTTGMTIRETIPTPNSTAAFSATLDKLHAWFSQDSTTDMQRLMTVYSLARRMPEWQQHLLLQLLSAPFKNDEHQETNRGETSRRYERRHDSSPLLFNPGLGDDDLGRRVASPTPVRPDSPVPHFIVGSEDLASSLSEADYTSPDYSHYYVNNTNSTPNLYAIPGGVLGPVFAHLFWSDFRAWLRALRLHKYDPVLTPYVLLNDDHTVNNMMSLKDGVPRGRLAMLLKWGDDELKKAGIATQGARNKFLRCFEMVRNSPQSIPYIQQQTLTIDDNDESIRREHENSCPTTKILASSLPLRSVARSPSSIR